MTWFEETRGVNFELVRHFLGQLFDSEMFSTRGQWRTVAISAFALAAPAGVLLLDPPYMLRHKVAHSGGITDELAVLTLLFAITGVLALLAWQSFYPSRRDFLALASFPARPRQIFIARFLSILLLALAMVTTLCALPSLMPPHFFTAPGHPAIVARGLPAILGCFFVFFAMVALQGVLMNALPRRLFTPVSTLVQGALVGLFFLAGLYSWFIVDWKPEQVARLPEFAPWAPPVWFAGLHQVLTGDRAPFYGSLAQRAVTAAAGVFLLSALMYLISYRRYRKLLLETPESVRPIWSWSLLRLIASSPRQEAILQFLATTLARSRTHRLVLMAYAGAALGIMINSILLTGVRHGSHGAVQFAVLYWPLGTSCILLSGIHHVFSLPVERSSNWLFQITESQGRREWMSAVERFVVVLVILPIYLISTPMAALVLDWPIAVRMAILQLLVSLTTFDLLFNEWQQLPFACSYVPGKKSLMNLVATWIAVLGVVTPILTIVISTVARMPELFLIYGAFFTGDWIWARRRRMEGWGESRLLYEDLYGAPASLGIHEMTYRTADVDVPWADEQSYAVDPPEIPEPSPAMWLRLKSLVHRDQLDQDLDDELKFHLSMNERSAVSHEFGNVALVKEECREQWTFAWLETFWQDLRYGARQLRRAPSFTFVAVLTLTVGTGATIAVYSMCDTVLWRPVALPQVESLVMVLQAFPGNPHLWSPAAPADIADIRSASSSLESLASWSYSMANLVAAGGEPVRVEQVRVTANFFDVLGVQPAMGRTFGGEDRVAILSDGCWRRRFGADPGIVGKSIWLNDRLVTVTGVMPASFAFPRVSKEVWTPLVLTPGEARSRDLVMIDSIARLKAGRSVREAGAELEVMADRLEKLHPGTNRNRRFLAWPVQRFWTGDYAVQYSRMLLGAAIFVLLICCANVANLQFARASRRGSEIGIRSALGAGRLRVVRQLLTESLLLACLGAVGGLQAATWALHIIKAGVPTEMRQYMPGWADIGLNSRALLLALITTVMTGILAGLSPALWATRTDLVNTLKKGSEMASSRGRRRLRGVLVAGEIALATILLIGAGMMVEGFRSNLNGGAGLEPDTLLTLRLSLSDTAYPEIPRVRGFCNDVLRRIAAIPGVHSAAITTALPHSRHANIREFEMEGGRVQSGESGRTQVQSVSDGYFATMRVALQTGRLLTAMDGPDQPPVAVITGSLAARWWPGANPLGRHIRLGSAKSPWITIVGVVADIETSTLNGTLQPALYLSNLQSPEREMDVAIRAANPMNLAREVRAAVRAIDPRQPITNVATLRELIRQEAFGLVYVATLMSAFGALALALSFIGVYGLVSYLVSERTREIGIRMAVGANPRSIAGVFFRDGFRMAAMGLACGLLTATALGRVLRATMVGVSADFNLLVWLLPAALAATVALAIYISARKSTRVDPVLALRQE